MEPESYNQIPRPGETWSQNAYYTPVPIRYAPVGFRDILKYIVQFLNIGGTMFFTVAAIMIAIKDEFSFNISTVRIVNGIQTVALLGNYDDIDSSERITACNTLHGLELEFCMLTKVPEISTALNSPGSIWPGKSMDKSFILFMVCINYLMFATTFIGYPKKWDPMGYIPATKAMWLLLVALATMVTLGFYAWDRGTGNSSIFVGLVFFFATMSYCTMYVFWERNTLDNNAPIQERSVLWGSMDNDKAMSLYYTRVLCTTPMLLYVVLIELNPSYGDFLYNVVIWVSVVMFVTMLLLEEKMFRMKRDVMNAQQDYGLTSVLSVNTYNYKSEKMAYIVVVLFTFATYIVSVSVAGDFYAIAGEEYAASSDARLAYHFLFWIKLVEITFSLIMYTIDEVQTYFTYLDSDGKQQMRQGSEPIMLQFSAFRYTLHSTLDYIIVLSIIGMYLKTLYE
eukprot:3941193-Rhodomonas_salina.2